MIRVWPAIILAFLSSAAAAVSATERPNILFLFADDQCYETIRALGDEAIETPNLDRLVRSGTSFTRAYNMGSWSGAVCVASRHMLNTGAHVWHAEKISQRLGGAGKKAKAKAAESNPWPDFQAKGWMWSQLMEQAGYDTYFTGKWHVNAPADQVFKVTRNIRGGMPKDTKAGYSRPVEGQPDPWDPADPKFGGFWEGGRHWSEVTADDAVDFIGLAGKSANPFFMYVAFNAPHDPRQSPQSFLDRYPVETMKVPANFLPEYPWKDQIDNRPSLRDEALAPFPRTEYAVRVHRREYYALITHLDEQIGRILDALDASGLAKDTWVFYSADHGLAVGHHGLIGKQNLFEHSTRVPLIVSGPGVPADSRLDAPVYLQDIMATSLDLAGAERPGHVQFRSLKPILEGKSGGYDAIYGAYLKSQRSVTRDGFKLILYPNVPKALLFDLTSDPGEMRDLLAGSPGADVTERAKALFDTFKTLQRETGDTLEVRRESYPELAK